MIELFTARSGAPSLRVDGRALHSPYDPAQEAERFVGQGEGVAPSAVVLLGEALGYAAGSLHTRFPDARLILVYYAKEIFDVSAPAAGISWHPGLDISLPQFLRRHVGELDLEGLQVLEWPASARLFPDISIAANQAVHQVVQELNGSFLTTMRAGRLWIRNSIANYLALETALVGAPCPAHRPVIVAASGPTLEEAAPLIARFRSRIDLWALPSSCRALRSAGLEPDLVVLTDPGFYAMQHLRFAGVSCPLAMPLSAARGSWSIPAAGARGLPAYLLAQPGFFETPLLHSLGIDAPVVLPHGTVAATAIDLALAFCQAPVIVAGLDMCSRDLATHARPGEFDQLLQIAATRLAPHTSLIFARAETQRLQKAPAAETVRVSPSLRTYAGWFSERTQERADRVFRLLPSAIPLDGMESVDEHSLERLLAAGTGPQGGTPLRPWQRLPSHEQRRTVVAGLLEGWKDQLSTTLAAVKRSRGLTAIAERPTVLALAYHVEPQLLIEARRQARRGDPAGALAKASDMLLGCIDFLDGLASRARGGA